MHGDRAAVRFGAVAPDPPMRLPLALLLAAALAVPAAAQASGLYLVGFADRTSFDDFATSAFAETYNAYYAQRIERELPAFEADPVGATVGGLWRLNVGGPALALGYTYTARPGYDETADLGGVGQRFTLDAWDHTVWAEGTIGLGPAFVGGFMTALLRGQRVTARTVYADGSESLGTEYTLNGTYTGYTSGNEVGVTAGIALGDRLVVPVRYVVTTATYLANREDNPIADDDVFELNSAFPREFDRFLRDRNGLDFGNALSGDDFHGPRLLVGLELRLF